MGKWIFMIGFLVMSSAFGQVKCSPDAEDYDLLMAAQDYLNQAKYDDALVCLNLTSEGFQKLPHVSKAFAAAYAGKCGLNFFDFVNLITYSPPGAPFQVLMTAMTPVDVFPAYCYKAQTVLEKAYGDSPEIRPQEVNFFLGVLGLAEMGALLRAKADSNQDGVVDATFTSACTNSASNMTDSAVRILGSGLGLFFENLRDISATMASSPLVNQLNSLSAVCGPDCNIKDPRSSLWNSRSLNMIRSITESSMFGIMQCNSPYVYDCCP
jgi:hypothetical protein